MDDEFAGLILARLQAQWPSIAADDVGATDWLNIVRRADAQLGNEVTFSLIANWTKDRGPRPGDWMEAYRKLALSRREEAKTLPEIEGPLMPAERVHALVASAAEKCRLTYATKVAAVPPIPRKPARSTACVHSVWRETLTPDELICVSCGTVTIREAE